jgi:hypothetical protein
MKIIKLRSRIGSDGTLHLDLPIGLTDTELEIIITVEPVKTLTEEELGWSPGFFEKTAGAWEGEPLIREPQGEREFSRVSSLKLEDWEIDI